MASFVTHSPEQAGPTPKVHKNGSKPTRLIHQKTHIFQTVNHAKVIWDPAIKPRGIFGGHLNIRSLLPKHDEIQALWWTQTWIIYVLVKAGFIVRL